MNDEELDEFNKFKSNLVKDFERINSSLKSMSINIQSLTEQMVSTDKKLEEQLKNHELDLHKHKLGIRVLFIMAASGGALGGAASLIAKLLGMG